MPDVTDTLDVSQLATHRLVENLDVVSVSQSASQAIAERISDELSSSSELTFSFGDTEIPVVNINIDGVDPDGYYLPDSTRFIVENLDQRTIIEVVSQSLSSETVTIETSYTRDELELEDRTVSVPAGATKYIGPFPSYIYNFGLTDLYIDQTNPGSMKFRAFRLI